MLALTVATAAFQVPHGSPMAFQYAPQASTPAVSSHLAVTCRYSRAAMCAAVAEDATPAVHTEEPKTFADMEVDLSMIKSELIGEQSKVALLKEEKAALKLELVAVQQELAAARKEAKGVILSWKMLYNPKLVVQVMATLVVGTLGALGDVIGAVFKTAVGVVAAPARMVSAYQESQSLAKAREAQRRGQILAIDENDEVIAVKAVVMPDDAKPYAVRKLQAVRAIPVAMPEEAPEAELEAATA